MVILTVVALAFYNPTMDDFKIFVATQSERILDIEMGDSQLGRALSGFAARLAGQNIDRITDRRNYVVFSTYSINLGGTNGEWRFVGIGGQFVETRRPGALQAPAPQR
jgi:hypothetical protein